MITVIQIIVSILLIGCIVVQHRASGLSATFGGSGELAVIQRRGAEKLIYNLTIVLSISFFSLSVLQWYVG
ncbi:preprotein translocase subunit SecG [Candidatus Peregrinibacteria bacterium]|nr:preprotein translocase subunit SecG [Candidatus Peregrinibacteria bacterium]MBT3598350.1 preprotein translocase subunit SecG [Candidatus Peregrinibacteria bacterium]MBT4367725.1 preprotein translocase subunit SecG [Candidatus Peregrinibacteria bacterium]MBT4585702.1 preprotein translocase subunit SecG [Candidatus Peregrinibacteria bacterium]MBT6730544.1 preprotein translocase subunit SecG [Candidatus Peregrinibacteria bacterium]